MAIIFNSLIPEKMYRTHGQYNLPYGTKSVSQGNMVTVLSQNINDTLNFFKNPFISLRNYRRYYIERMHKYNILGKTYNIRNNYKDIISNNINASKLNISLIPSITQIKDYNLIYEFGQYIELVNNDRHIISSSVNNRAEYKSQLLIEGLNYIDGLFPHPNKYLYIPVDEYIANTRDSTMYVKQQFKENPVILIWRIIDKQPELLSKLKNWSLVFINYNELFYVKCKDINSLTSKTIKALIKQYRSTEVSINIDEKEDGINDDQSTNMMTELSNEEKIKLIEDAIKNKVKDLNLSEEAVKKIIDTAIDIQKKTNIVKENNSSQIDELLNNADVKLILNNEIKLIMNPQSAARLAREEKIKNKINKLQVDGKSIDELKLEAEKSTIEPKKINASIINNDLKNIKFGNFDKSYDEKMLEADIMDVLTSFAEKDRPLYLISIKKEDISDNINKIYLYTCIYEDEKGRRHNLIFELPKLIDDEFLFLNGSDKIFINQLVILPITKTAPDTVQIASYYNKIFIKRFGKMISPKISKFHKAISDVHKTTANILRGNALSSNKEYMTTLEYDELANKYIKISMHKGELIIYLKQKDIRDICKKENIKFNEETQLPFAIINDNGVSKLIVIDIHSDTILGTNLSPIDFIINEIEIDQPGFKDKFIKLNVGRKYMYTRAKIMAKDVPLVILLSFLTGLEPLLNIAKIKYKFTEKRPILRGEDAINKAIIQFADGYLTYEQYPFANSLLMNGFVEIPTKEFNFLQFSGKDIYYELFTNVYGRRNLGNAFENFGQLFIDKKTKKILADNNLPTDFTRVMLYANTLLENNAHTYDGDLKNYRLRKNEMIVAHLYKVLSSAYERYRSTADNKNPVKFSIKKNEVIEDILTSQITEEYSASGPIPEIEKMRSTSYKGQGGRNLERAFKLSTRSYNDSMLGVLAQSSPISANIGISRRLSIDPNITSLEGYIKEGDKNNLQDLKSTNIASGAELLVPMTITKDDAQRVSMASIQSGNTASTVDSDTPLFGTGFDRTLAHMVSNKFAYKAKKDGYVKEINQKLGYMLLKYNDGTSDIVNIKDKQEKNAGQGSYISNQLIPYFKEGDKFKADDIIAGNKEFFTKDIITGNVIYKTGPLARVAVVHNPNTYEDSCLITDKLAERLTSYVTHKKDIRLGKNSNIYYIAKIGDKVSVNDPLMIFDESYEDEYLNKLLAKMNEDIIEDIKDSAKTPIRSGFNGYVADIKLFYTLPKNEYSETIQKIITEYEKDIIARGNIFRKEGVNIKDLTSLNELSGPTKLINNKIGGIKMDDFQLLIQFYIKVKDKFGVGDKLTFQNALKGINGSLIPIGQEPFLASEPETKIDAFLAVNGIYGRMTNSANISMGVNAVMLAMEKKVKGVYEKYFGKIEEKK